MNWKPSIKDLSIRTTVLIVYIALMVTTVGGIGTIVFTNWLSSTDEISERIINDLTDDVFSEMDSFSSVPIQLIRDNRQLIEQGVVDLTDEVEREKFFVSVLDMQPAALYSFSYGSETGDYYGARRNAAGDIEIMRNDVGTNGYSWYYSVSEDLTAGDRTVVAGLFDVRTRDWYQAANEHGGAVFSPVYKHFVMNDLTVSAATPILDPDGETRGVLGAHIVLSSMNHYLTELVNEYQGLALIVERESGDFIANSFDFPNFEIRPDGTVERMNIQRVPDPVIRNAYDHYLNTVDPHYPAETDGKPLHLHMSDFQQNGLDWIVLVVIPEPDFISAVYDNIYLSLLMVGGALILTFLLYLFLTGKMMKPMDELIEVSERMAGGDLSQRAMVTRYNETGRMAAAFNHMADTLTDLINRLEEKVQERTTELQESQNQLQLLLDSTAEGIYGIDMDGICTFCNTSGVAILGYEQPEQLVGKNMHWLIHHSRRDGTPIPPQECKIIKAIREGKGTHVDDEVFWRADGTCFDVEYDSYPQFEDQKIIGAVVNFQDITERKAADERIRYLSCHDSLTGLLNRMCFETELNQLDSAHVLPLSIIFGDLNGLKLTNDIFGHAAGDALLIRAADVLKKICRSDDIVARVGGDEFVIILPGTPAHDVEKIIQRIHEELSKTKMNAIRCSLSMGYDTKTDSWQSVERIMENAENNMYKEKTLVRENLRADMVDSIIATLHEKSPWSRRHATAVSRLCADIGQAMDLSDTEINKVGQAGYFHDIGHIILDENDLQSEPAMQEEESTVLKQHPVIGYRVLNAFEDTMDLAEPVLSHHEHWDGSGYPRGLKGEKIPLLARIIAVAEHFDRMTHPTLDTEAMSPVKAMDVLRERSGTMFDPAIIEHFTRMMEERSDEENPS